MRRFLVLALFLIAPLGAYSSADAQTPAAVPPNLAVPAGHFTAFQLMANGVQIYACQAKADDPNAFDWTFRAPEATMMNARGEVVGRHYAGPTWEGADGSKIIGVARANADGPDAAAIPWLLLQAQSNDGVGLFGTVTYVQRLETSGGRAPADGCGMATAGQELRVPYTATYTFSYPTAAAPQM